MLYHQFLTNSGRAIHKWPHYIPIYERHLERFRNTSLVLWEIGVQNGGSAQMWKHYLGPFATIVGIDIDPACRECEEEQIHIRIGDQTDTGFLRGILDEFGPPDIIIDDGSHKMQDIRKTFTFAYDKLPDNGVYLVEDLHTCYWAEYGGGLHVPESFMEVCKKLIDALNAHHSRGAVPPGSFAASTFSMCFYDSVVVFEKRKRPRDLKSILVGTELTAQCPPTE